MSKKACNHFCGEACLTAKNLFANNMKLTIATCLLSGMLLFSCDDSAEHELVNTLGTDVQFSMAEYFEPGQRTLSFKFLTQKDFPCINYRIKSDYRMEGDALVVSLSEVEGADVCLEAIAPASSFLDVGQLAIGEYPVVIKVGEVLTNTGTLTVTDESFDLVMNEEQGLVVETPRVLRIPSGVVWGRIYATDPDAVGSVTQDVLNQLQGAGATSKILLEGDYGYFSVDASGNIVNSSVSADRTERMFLLDYPGESTHLERLVEEVASVYDGKVAISLRTATGEELKSWSQN